MCIKKWDHLLKHWYGDYMKLPLIVDFENDYVSI